MRHMARLKTGPRRYSKKAVKREAAITIESVREGLSIESLRKVAENLGIDERSLAEALNIPSRTFDRRLKVGILRPTESDRLARVARLLDRATEIFGSVEKARGWMSTPLAAFGGETPLQRADTSVGAMQVDKLLGRIDYGVYS